MAKYISAAEASDSVSDRFLRNYVQIAQAHNFVECMINVP